MKRLRFRILIGVSVVLILTGMAPMVAAFWQAANSEPLVMPLPLKRGIYTSPYFRTWLNDDYQISVYPIDPCCPPPEMDWKVVNRAGAVIDSGSLENQPGGGNSFSLGHYRPKIGSSQRIVVDVKQDAGGATSAPDLHIGDPEIGLSMGYALPLLLAWVLVVGGAGAVMLIAVVFRRRRARAASV